MPTSARGDHPRLHWGLLISALVVLAFSLWATYFVTELSRSFLARQARTSFDQETLDAQNRMVTHLNDYLGALRATQGLVLSSQTVEADEWNGFVETLNLPTYYPGISQLAYVENVATDSSTLNLVVKYVAPQNENSQPQPGMAYNSPEALQAAQQALQTGSPAATNPMPDPDHPGVQIFSIALPLRIIPSDESESAAPTTTGFVVAFFRTDRLFAELFTANPLPPTVELDVYSGNIPNPNHILYKNYDEKTFDWELVPEWLYARQATVEIAGQTWTLRFSAPKTFSLSPFEQRLPLGLLVGGLLFTLGLCVLVAGFDSSRFRAMAIAKQMTSDLQRSEAQYRSIFESLQDVYYRTDMEGRITVISPSITRYIGLTPEEVKGRLATDFYVNPRERDDLLKQLKTKGSVTDYELALQGQGAQALTASLNARLILDEQGKPVGVEGVLRDVTERKEAQRRLQERTLEVERANRMMVDRELRMIELKKEIESLKAKLNLS